MRLNGDSKRIWKELVIAFFKDLPWNLPEGNKEEYKNLHKNRWCPIQELSYTVSDTGHNCYWLTKLSWLKIMLVWTDIWQLDGKHVQKLQTRYKHISKTSILHLKHWKLFLLSPFPSQCSRSSCNALNLNMKFSSLVHSTRWPDSDETLYTDPSGPWRSSSWFSDRNASSAVQYHPEYFPSYMCPPSFNRFCWKSWHYKIHLLQHVRLKSMDDFLNSYRVQMRNSNIMYCTVTARKSVHQWLQHISMTRSSKWRMPRFIVCKMACIQKAKFS